MIHILDREGRLLGLASQSLFVQPHYEGDRVALAVPYEGRPRPDTEETLEAARTVVYKNVFIWNRVAWFVNGQPREEWFLVADGEVSEGIWDNPGMIRWSRT